MATPVLLASESVAGQTSFLKDIRPGKYAAFFLKLSGDSLAATQLTPAGFGRVEILQAGTPIVSVDYDNMRDVDQLKLGNVKTENVLGGLHEFPLLIPRGYWDSNVHQVNLGDQLQCRINYGAGFTGVFTGADVAVQKVYGVVREIGEMAYNLNIHQVDHNFSTGTFEETYNFENVMAIYVIQNASPPGLRRIQVLKDDRELTNVAFGTGVAEAEEDLQELSSILSGREAATDFVLTSETPLIAEIDVAQPGNVGEWLSDRITVRYTTGAAYTQEVVFFHGDFTDTKLRQTKAETASEVQRKVARKQQHGRTRPVRVVEELGR